MHRCPHQFDRCFQKHPNLQAALDAVPESGRLVTIPPANYEIMEPLRVKTAETRNIGAGKNKRPAEHKTLMGIDEGTEVLVEEGVNGLILNGNTFAGLSTAAVWSTGLVKNVLVSCNLCLDCGRKLAKDSAWFSFEQKTRVMLKGNLNETSTTDP